MTNSTRITSGIICIIVFSALVAIGNGRDLWSILGYTGFATALIYFTSTRGNTTKK